MIVHGTTDSFALEILPAFAIHRPEDKYRIALYREDAVLSRLTTAYTTKGEVIGSKGYSPGGQLLSGLVAKFDGGFAIMSWTENPLWPDATITARGALIYNFSKQNRAVTVMDFGENISNHNGPFLVTMPEFTRDTALIRIG